VGMALIGAGMLVFADISPTGSYLGDILLPSLLVAVGMGLAFVPVTIAAVAGVQRHEAGLASGLVNTSRQFGGSLGLAILVTMAGERTHHLLSAHASAAAGHAALTSGYARGFEIGAAFAFAGAIAAALLIPRVKPGQAPHAQAPAPAEA
jgi:hypothetical protein